MKSTAALPRARKDGLVIKELPNETLVYDLERDEAHCLNQTAALVWKRCDGKTTIAKMTGLLQEQLDTSVNADVVWLAIKQLQRFHLVESYVHVATPSVSRRNLVLKYAPAALVLPFIMSISAPAAAAAATPTPAPTPDPCIANPGGLGCPCSNDNDCDTFNCNAGVCGPQLKPKPEG